MEFLNNNNDSSTGVRFELPTNEVAKERLDIFRKAVKEFQTEHPEVLGATVYGSMIKGKQANESSDIDACVYIDSDSEDYAGQDEDFYKESLIAKTGLVDGDDGLEYVEHLKPVLINEKKIDDEITAQASFFSKEKEIDKRILELNDEMKKAEIGTDSARVLECKKEKEKLYKEKLNTRNTEFWLTGMFHARVGSGIEKYRKMFLEKIASLPDKDISERIWSKDVAESLRIFEERWDSSTEVLIPKTLEKALEVYHPEFLEKKIMADIAK